MQVAICIATYRRPVGLERLLRALPLLRQPYGVDLVVLVVDNDEARSAAPVVDAIAAELPWPVRYRVEPRRGVSCVRNTALTLAGDCAFVAFIDDDEVPESDWLADLLLVQSQTGATAVSGPVLPVFTGVVPPWLTHAFALCYVRPRPGRPLTEFSTSNLLLDRAKLAELDLVFDETLTMIGGEDTMLAHDLVRHGCRLAWAERALAYEYIPASRTTLGWLLRRWYRTGNTEVVLTQRRGVGRLGQVRGLTRGGVRVVLGLAGLLICLPACLIGRQGRALRRSYTVARGLGMLAGVCGRHYAEYDTTHGA